LQLGGKAEAMKEAEDEHRQASVRLKPEKPLEAVHVLERFVHDREANHRVDKERIRAYSSEHSGQERDAMADRKQADVEQDVLQAMQEEDDTQQEEQVIVAGHHVLR